MGRLSATFRANKHTTKCCQCATAVEKPVWKQQGAAGVSNISIFYSLKPLEPNRHAQNQLQPFDSTNNSWYVISRGWKDEKIWVYKQNRGSNKTIMNCLLYCDVQIKSWFWFHVQNNTRATLLLQDCLMEALLSPKMTQVKSFKAVMRILFSKNTCFASNVFGIFRKRRAKVPEPFIQFIEATI